MIQYYFLMDYDESSATYNKPVGVNRWGDQDSGVGMERWDGLKWVWSSRLATVTGIGGDTDYEPTTEKKAMAYIAGKRLRA
jgi:hypothetical protein